jgi:secreted trypsin-like serine protease
MILINIQQMGTISLLGRCPSIDEQVPDDASSCRKVEERRRTCADWKTVVGTPSVPRPDLQVKATCIANEDNMQTPRSIQIRTILHSKLQEIMLYSAIASLAIATPVCALAGGTVAPKLKYPYMASVRRSGEHVCGGVLIDETTILTSASCADVLTASGATVRLGLNTLNNPEAGYQQSVVSQIISHPDWSSRSSWNHDVALLKLETSITRLAAAKLPKADVSPAPGKTVTIVGWGITSPGGPPSTGNQLREASLPVISLSACQAAYQGESLSDNVFCDALKDGGRGACAGDQGGPVIASDGTLAGIISGPTEADSCGSAKAPGVSVNLSKYLEWIREATVQGTEAVGNAKKADL